jgi:hypothetical protein
MWGWVSTIVNKFKNNPVKSCIGISAVVATGAAYVYGTAAVAGAVGAVARHACALVINHPVMSTAVTTTGAIVGGSKILGYELIKTTQKESQNKSAAEAAKKACQTEIEGLQTNLSQEIKEKSKLEQDLEEQKAEKQTLFNTNDNLTRNLDNASLQQAMNTLTVKMNTLTEKLSNLMERNSLFEGQNQQATGLPPEREGGVGVAEAADGMGPGVGITGVRHRLFNAQQQSNGVADMHDSDEEQANNPGVAPQ